MNRSIVAIALVLLSVTFAHAQEGHHHGTPEHLGTVHFGASCAPAVTAAFDRAVALLHSFSYEEADAGFADVAARDPGCAMAHWGRAMTHYHQLWDVPAGAGLAAGEAGIAKAEHIGSRTPRERALIGALGAYYAHATDVPAAVRAMRYSDAMAAVARKYPKDDEVATFYALSLIATASPADRTHTRQKQAADILEPIWKRQPDHPGVPHYLIHAYDSAALAQRGLPAARAYAKIAPSAPHALHMPSHIFTRLGLWDDSIASNINSRNAARAQGDVGEQLHAMDYLTYAYLQRGRPADAAKEVAALRTMRGLSGASFKIGYAGNAMPVRLAVETRDWATAAQLSPSPGSTPQVAALVWWARALGKLRAPTPVSADADISRLAACRDALDAAHDAYWTAQVDALLKSAQGWRSAAAGQDAAAITALTAAADEEDGLEKLPLTPGPIVPAREQLGEILLAAGKPREALDAFNAALAQAPGRLGALRGKAEAERRISAPSGIEAMR
jgi:tetratricopeptide (TPR) repeat protein